MSLQPLQLLNIYSVPIIGTVTFLLAVALPRGLAVLPAIIALAACSLFGRRTINAVRRDDTEILLPVALFLLWAFVQSVRSPDPRYAVLLITGVMVTAVAGYILVLAFRAHVAGSRAADAFVAIYVVSVAVLALVCTRLIELPWLKGGNTAAIWGFNRAAVAIALFLPVSLCLCVIERRTRGRLGLAVFLTCTASAVIFLSDSQSAQFAVIAGTASFLCFLCSSRAAAWLFGVGIALITLILPFLIRVFLPLLQESWFWQFQPGTFAERIKIWAATASLIQTSPFWGHGTEITRFLAMSDPLTGLHGVAWHPHSIIFQLWADLGIVGVLLFIWIILRLFIRIGTTQSIYNAAFGGVMVATFTVGSVSHGMWQGWWIALLSLLFVPLGLLRNLEQKAPPEKLDYTGFKVRLMKMTKIYGTARDALWFVSNCLLAIILAYLLRDGFSSNLLFERIAVDGAIVSLSAVFILIVCQTRTWHAVTKGWDRIRLFSAISLMLVVAWVVALFFIKGTLSIPRSIPPLAAWILITLLVFQERILPNSSILSRLTPAQYGPHSGNTEQPRID